MRLRSLLHPSPEYVWRPRQIARRLRFERRAGRCLAPLPWGERIEVDVSESVGSGIARLGVHELRVSEAIWRLTDEADLALDVGANIGYFTSLLSRRADRVLALEPHPQLCARLRANVARWPGRVTIEERAASDERGIALLGEPEAFGRNAGTAGLGLDGARSFEVATVTLDELIGGASVGVCKIDVEGHELEALRGAERALAAGRIRDLFFEEREPLPTPVSSLLRSHGFWLFSLWQRLDGVSLRPAALAQASDWDAPTYLATRAPGRALRRLRARGFRCLRGKNRRGRPVPMTEP